MSFKSLSLIVLLASASLLAGAQTEKTAFGTSHTRSDSAYDVFTPIGKYLLLGDAEKLSAWFADNLEIKVLSQVNDASRDQARQIVKSFFDNYRPRSFELSHTVGKNASKYGVGLMNAGGETFRVTILVNYDGNGYWIRQLRIEH